LWLCLENVLCPPVVSHSAHGWWVHVNLKSDRPRASGYLTYGRMWELLKANRDKLWFSSEKLSLHSFRAGGVTAVARAGIPDRDFKCHGHWKSEKAKDWGYFRKMIKSLQGSWLIVVPCILGLLKMDCSELSSVSLYINYVSGTTIFWPLKIMLQILLIS